MDDDFNNQLFTITKHDLMLLVQALSAQMEEHRSLLSILTQIAKQNGIKTDEKRQESSC